MRVVLGSLAAILAIGACQPAPPATLTDADRATVDSMSRVFSEKMVSGDWAGLVKMYYADDAILLPPNMPSVTGHAAIEAAFRTFPPITSASLHTEEVAGSGDMAYVRGTYRMTMAPPGGAAIADSGKYLEIWKKQADGSWKSARDMFSSDVPIPAPPEPAKKP